jgi:phosphomannomutase
MSDTLMVSVSGVRGLVGRDLTPEMIARWAAAFGTWAKAGKGKRRVVLGRDARTSGPMFAQAATAGLNSVGCDVIDVGLVATPTVQLAVEHHRAAGGIILTASHNPIEWNALKFVGPDGIFLDTVAGTRVRELAAGESLPRANYNAIGGVEADSEAISRHLAAVLALRAVDGRAIRRRKFRVALDTVRGAGGALMPELFERLGCRVAAINLETDGLFPRPPEPVPENLKALGALVRRKRADIGIAVDPDVDRLAIVDEKGRAIGEDYTLALAIRAVLGHRPGRPAGRRPVVVCNLSTSLVVEDAAKEFGAEVVRAPVGEAHVARQIIERKAVIGGEGNGGVMYPALHVGRDAPVAGALVLSLLARERVQVSELIARAPQYTIVKAKQELGAGSRAPGKLDTVYAAMRRRFAEAIADTQDGLRLSWPDRWLHVRPSGTEPIIRFIAEAPSSGDAQQLIEEGRRLCAGS